ncbi:MAG: sigma-70 family RNA polymerase sigma factor, partial [Verrucomicrobia bacterium]|nr:sigma-70 family RNA polymerase sigma factor [Verrucomicrobiota bacterium]
MNDWTLIREYVEQGSEVAFATLVRQYVDLVHAAALRQVHEPHLAEDVTQAVFVVLARKAARLNSGVILPAWLHRTACLVARQVQRNETRRMLREQESLPMITDPDPTAEAWSTLGPQVDRALNDLRAADREAVVLRYLQRCTFREVGQRLGITEEAAKKRVSRALELMRLRLRDLGITVTSGAMGAALTAHGSAPAPATVLASALKSCSSAGTAGSPIVAALVDDVLREPTLIRLGGIAAAAAAVVAVVVGLLLVTGIVFWAGRAPDPVANEPVAAQESLAGADVLPTASVAPPDLEAARRMTLRYLATDSDEPLAGVTVRSTFQGRPPLQSEAVTDAAGEVIITRPDRRFEGMNVIAFLPAHTPLLKLWQRGEEPSLPREYTLRLRRGMTVAGRVVDSEGRPIAGARLQFGGGGTQWDTHEQVTYNDPVPNPVTDAQGHWAADFLDPAVPLIRGRIEHRDYAPTLFGAGRVAAGTNLVFVLQRGVAVRGFVRDASGLAVPRAEIRLENVADDLRSHSTTTDAAGSYEFARVAAGNYRREVKAAGHQPLHGHLDVGSTALQEDLVLQPAPGLGSSLMRGRLVSRTGEWLGHAAVTLMSGQPGLEDANWTIPVPEDGHWEWRTAPDRPVQLIFSAWRHQSRIIEFTPGDAVVEVVLDFTQDILVHGTVHSDATGDPVPRFRIIRAGNPMRNEYIGNAKLLGEGFNGRFAFRVAPEDLEPGWILPGHPKSWAGARVMIQAEGMLEQIFPLPSATNGEVVADLR